MKTKKNHFGNSQFIFLYKLSILAQQLVQLLQHTPIRGLRKMVQRGWIQRVHDERLSKRTSLGVLNKSIASTHGSRAEARRQADKSVRHNIIATRVAIKPARHANLVLLQLLYLRTIFSELSCSFGTKSTTCATKTALFRRFTTKISK